MMSSSESPRHFYTAQLVLSKYLARKNTDAIEILQRKFPAILVARLLITERY